MQAREVDRARVTEHADLGARPAIERLAIDQLHAEEVAIRVGEQLVQAHEVGVREIGDRSELALQAVDRGAVHCGQRFDRDDHVLRGVVGRVDHAHAACADAPDHHKAPAAQRGAGREMTAAEIRQRQRRRARDLP
jgi:hypothetical protein